MKRLIESRRANCWLRPHAGSRLFAGLDPDGLPGGKGPGRGHSHRGQRQHRGHQRIPHPGQDGGGVRSAGRCRQGLAGGVCRGQVLRGLGLSGRRPAYPRMVSAWCGRRGHPGPQLHLLAAFQRRQGHCHFGRRAGGAGAVGAADHAGHLDRGVCAEPLCVARLDLRRVRPALRRVADRGKPDHHRSHGRAGGAGDLQAQGQHQAADQRHREPHRAEEDSTGRVTESQPHEDHRIRRRRVGDSPGAAAARRRKRGHALGPHARSGWRKSARPDATIASCRASPCRAR